MRAERTRDGDSSLALDDRHYPVLISKWFGQPTTVLATSYFDWLGLMIDRAVFYETRVVHVIDASNASLPEAPVRTLLARSAAEMHQRFADSDAFLGAIITPDNNVVRGVLTVIRWSLTNVSLPLTMADSLDEALEQATSQLQQAGIELPANLDPKHYRLDESVMSMLPETSGTSFRVIPNKRKERY